MHLPIIIIYYFIINLKMKKLLVIASILAMFTLASCNNATQNEEEVLMDETNVETTEVETMDETTEVETTEVQ